VSETYTYEDVFSDLEKSDLRWEDLKTYLKKKIKRLEKDYQSNTGFQYRLNCSDKIHELNLVLRKIKKLEEDKHATKVKKEEEAG